jgi:glycosyltransferase involved in cell wall biosynthesis
MSRATPLPRPRSIWIVNPSDDIPGEGLPPQRAWSLARVLTARGHDVTWWSATWSGRRKAIRRMPIGVHEDEGFSVRLVAVRPYERDVSLARFASHRDFGRSFERLASESIASGQLRRPDIILAALPPLEGPEACVRLARRLDATLVVDLTDAWPETFEQQLPGPRWLRNIVAPVLVRSMLRRRRAVIESVDAISSVARPLVDTAVADVPTALGKPVHVCGVGAYPQEYPPPPRLNQAVPGSAGTAGGQEPAVPGDAGPGPVRCVFSDAAAPARDVDTLLAAARQLSSTGTPAVIHIVASGGIADSLRRSADAVGGSCRVHVHGPLDRPAHARLLSDCDIGIVLGGPESSPAVPGNASDYAAAGLAIVHSLPGELDELVESRHAGMRFAAGNPASLAQAVATLAADRGRLLDLRHDARRLAEGEFDREKTYPRFAAWLEDVAD